MKVVENKESKIVNKNSVQTKFVLKTVALSAASFVFVVYLVMTFLTLGMPVLMSDFYDSIGLKSLSYTAKDIAYRNSNEIKDVHSMFVSSSKQKNYTNLLYYSDKLFTASDYDEYLKEVDAKNFIATKDQAILIRLSVGSENNFVKGQYVNALIKKNRNVEALNYAKNNIAELNIAFTSKSAFVLPVVVNNNLSISNEMVTALATAYEKCKLAETMFSTTVNGFESPSLVLEKKVMKLRLSEMAKILYNELAMEKYNTDYIEFLAAIIK